MFLALFVYPGTPYATLHIAGLLVVSRLSRPRHAYRSIVKGGKSSKALDEESRKGSPTTTPKTLATSRETRQT